MNNVQQYLAFASAARHTSFAKAARELALSPSAVAKSISRLETQLGVRLFYRTTRQVSLTPDGRTLFEQCQRVLEEVEILKSVAAGARSAPTGMLRVSAPLTFGKYVVLPVVQRLMEQHPALSVDLRLTDQVEDIVREGLDAAIRIGALGDSGLVARPFAEQVLTVCASPRYLKAHGKPKSPGDVEQHACVVFRLPSSGRDRPWEFRERGETLKLNPPSRLRLSDGEALVSAAIAGIGLVQTPHYMTESALSDGRLVECLAEFRPAPLPISIVHAGSRIVPPRVRAFIDALTGDAPVSAKRRRAPAR
jgi:LysR family transcriptional regulator, regulator for bpeEF and oprC